jgi:hypothetical protein
MGLRFIIFCLLLQLSATSVLADSGITFTTVPKQPVVMFAPLVINPGTEQERTILPPWVKYAPRIKNDSNSPITVVSFFHKVYYYFQGYLYRGGQSLPIPDQSYIEIPPHTTMTLPAMFLAQLPMADYGKYRFEIFIEGWYGTWEQPGRRLQVVTAMDTQ